MKGLQDVLTALSPGSCAFTLRPGHPDVVDVQDAVTSEPYTTVPPFPPTLVARPPQALRSALDITTHCTGRTPRNASHNWRSYPCNFPGPVLSGCVSWMTLRSAGAESQGKRKVPPTDVLKITAGWHRQGRRPWRWLYARKSRHRQAALDDATHHI